MKRTPFHRIAVVFLSLGVGLSMLNAADGTPQLRRQGSATQLTVDGKPFLVVAGELHNSSSSSRSYMQPVWTRLADMNLNTVLASISWELVEPQEGQYDFSLVDELVADARSHDLRLVLLWFGAWKNGLSSYAPAWVKRDPKRFPRVQLGNGETPELLSPLSLSTAEVEARTFAAVMKHLRQLDGRQHTVLMVQVENEVGVVGDSRDRSAAANAEFSHAVPTEIMDLVLHKKSGIAPELAQAWEANGAKTSGSWTEVFGAGKPQDFALVYDLPEGLRQTEWRKFHWPSDELFMAWHYARYINVVAAAGKREYAIPMFVNAWLQQPGCSYPGTYPSGGPVPQVHDIWRVAAPAIDLLAPDLYVPEFAELAEKFTRAGNPFFIPETNRGPNAAANFFLAVGKYNAIGFSPFAIENTFLAPPPASPTPGRFAPPEVTLEQAYSVMRQIAPLVLQHQGTDRIVGFVVNKEHPSFVTSLGGSEVEISLDEVFGRRAEKGFGIVVASGKGEFYGAGVGFRVIFRPAGKTRFGLASVDEGIFRQGEWIKGRRLNGDETDQGRAWRFSPFGLSIAHCVTYSFE